MGSSVLTREPPNSRKPHPGFFINSAEILEGAEVDDVIVEMGSNSCGRLKRFIGRAPQN
jgi:hypothetical protein